MTNLDLYHKTARFSYNVPNGRLFVDISTDMFLKFIHNRPGNNNGMEVLDIKNGFNTLDVQHALIKLGIELSVADAYLIKEQVAKFLA
ncbi:hypothetical protein ACQ46_gp070 [Citrobacter phage Moon]|uniref:Uncharacterized protein n=1 Tax=Citrobacter phage Moon TaxID=1540095 RepID=A0A0A0YQ36_9CAUD|nr:hypothetical protein ACQ46_gp070 [Citrobacter phage Moon]AIX12041.1 hypothetical protein CPT_Moon70 [Citrobacter phage Moon]